MPLSSVIDGCPAVWHMRSAQPGSAKQRLFGFLLILIFAGLVLVTYLHNARYGWSGRVLPTNEIVIDYGVVMDCGSSGTRVFVYKWPRDTHEKELIDIEPLTDQLGNPVQKKVEPGLSSFASNPDDIEEYLRPLIDLAAQHIPQEQHSETVMYMLATAGMRMIPQEDQFIILNQIKLVVPNLTNFIFSDKNVGVITGKEEGIYAWIAANYVLGKLKFTKFGKKVSSTGIIDMGGGSMQIAFEVDDQNIINHENVSHVSLGATGLEYRLFVTTHLGFGANEALKRHIETLGTNEAPSSDACFPKGFGGEVDEKTLTGTGDFSACYESLRPLLNKGTCKDNDDSCSLDSTYQPSFTSTSEFFGFSEFYYTSEDTLKIAGVWDREKFTIAASEYCSTEWTMLISNWKAGMYKADENRVRNQCFKSAWVSLVLHEGLNFPEKGKKLTNVQTINGAEVQWALGALIYRTRYLPLRNTQPVATSFKSAGFESKSNGLFFVCIVAVLILSTAQYRKIYKSSRSPYIRIPLIRPESRVV